MTDNKQEEITPMVIDNFKRQSRLKALDIASQNKPSATYSQPAIGGYIPQQGTVKYNLIEEAEKIYQWLIKDL